jgi:hypothetical protein
MGSFLILGNKQLYYIKRGDIMETKKRIQDMLLTCKGCEIQNKCSVICDDIKTEMHPYIEKILEKSK